MITKTHLLNLFISLFVKFQSFVISMPKSFARGLRILIPRNLRQASSLLLCLLIISNQAMAAPTVASLLDVSQAYQREAASWWHTSRWAAAWQKSGKAAEPQETQFDRDARVMRIEVSPGEAELQAGETVVFAGTAYDAQQGTVGGVKFTWSIYDETSKTESPLPPDGKFTPYLAGKYRVIATALGRKGEAKLTVTGDDPRKRDNRPIGAPQIVSTKDDKLLNQSGQNSSQWQAVGEQQVARLSGGERTVLGNSALGRGKGLHASNKALGLARAFNYPTSCGDQNNWNDCNYASADDGGRERGNMPGHAPDAGAGSGNFQFAAPVVGLKGRGLDVNLGLVYNSRVWHKPADNSLEITYDIDKDWPAVGWTLGFGKLISVGPTAGVMMVEPDGTRHAFRASVSNVPVNQKKVDAKTSDGTFIDYTATCDANANGMIPRSGLATLPNGTVITYGAPGNKAIYPTQILDANGNYTTITYVNNSGPKIDTVTDTLGRQIKFWYDTNGLLTAITGPGYPSTGTRELVRLHYRSLMVNAAFASGTSTHVATSTNWMIDAIYYPPTNTGYWFGDGQTDPSYLSYGAYSTYGMLFKVSMQRGMTFSSSGVTDMGTVGAGTMSRQVVYNFPKTPDYTLSDTPKYTQMQATWAGIEPSAPNLTYDSTTSQWYAITNYSVNNSFWDAEVSANVERIEVTRPDGTKSAQYAYRSPGDFKDGLIYKDETLAANGTTLFAKSKVTWEYDTTACPSSGTFDYCAPRAQRAETTDDRGQLTARNYSYSIDSTLRRYNLLTQTDEFDYGGTTLIRRSKTEYVTNANYVTRHIFRLPSATEAYAADGTTRLARTEFYYDEFQGTSGLTDTPGVVQHNAASDPASGLYDPMTEYRGNLTSTKRFADATNLTAATAMVETRRYDISGNVVKAQPSCCEYVNTTYTSNTQYAYPETMKRGADTSAPQNTTSASYNFNWGLVLSTTDTNGRVTTQDYDTTTLRPNNIYKPTGATTQMLYDDVALKVTETAYIGAVGSTIVAKHEKYLDGLDRVTKEMTLGAGTNQDFAETKYEGMRRVWKQSRPYRSPDTPVYFVYQYDELGRTLVITSPDGSTTKTYYNQKYPTNSNAPYPSAATQGAAGQTILSLDQWGRERWSRMDSLGRLAEVVEPDPSITPTANPGDQVANNGYCTKYGYNVLNQLTNVYQGVTTGQPNGVQQRTFKYDGLSRLTHQKLAERDATLNDSGAFVATYNSTTKHWEGGNWSDYFQYDPRSNLTSQTDARGVKTNYNYNSDPLNRLQSMTYDTTGVPTALQSSIIAAANVSYAYMTSGDLTRLQQITDGMGTETFGYDVEGRPSQRIRTFTGRSAYPLQLDTVYDAASRVQDRTYPAKYGTSDPRPLLHHDYDNASRVSNLTANGAAYASSFIYNAASQVTSLNVGGTTNQLSEIYTYDLNNGLMTGQTVQRTNVGTLLNLSYDYLRPNTTTGKTGQLTKITNNLVGDKNRIYEYDGTGELKAAKGGATGTLWTQTYSYDRLGNRTSVAASGSSAGGGTMPADGLPATVNYEQASNRATSVVPNAQCNPSNANLEYDPAGNQTRALLGNCTTAQRYYYDAAGRLAQIKTDDNTAVITTYGYGASKQRLKQTEGVTTTYYAWSGGSIIGEYGDTGSALTWQKAYVYLGSRLLATQIPGTGTNATQFHHKDRLGTRLISNAGDIGYTENMVLPYGTLIVAESIGTTANNTPSRRFTSYDRGSDTVMLDYAVNRFYDCNQGRFTQLDPMGRGAARLGRPQSLNSYAYVSNDPVNQVDPTGLLTLIIGGFLAGNPDWGQRDTPFWQSVRDTFNEDPQVFPWSGIGVTAATGYIGIIQAGGELAGFINNYPFADGEKLNIVAHSDGGNVVKVASHYINHRIDNLVTLGTPQNFDLWAAGYFINTSAVKNYCNVSSLVDLIQFAGASPLQISATGYYSYYGGLYAFLAAEALFNGDFLSALRYSAAAKRNFTLASLWYLSTKLDPLADTNVLLGSESHSDLHAPFVWDRIKGDCGLPQ